MFPMLVEIIFYNFFSFQSVKSFQYKRFIQIVWYLWPDKIHKQQKLFLIRKVGTQNPFIFISTTITENAYYSFNFSQPYIRGGDQKANKHCFFYNGEYSAQKLGKTKIVKIRFRHKTKKKETKKMRHGPLSH